MSEWWESIGILEQIFIIIAAPASLVILIQTFMLIFGGGIDAPDSGLESDVSGLGDAGTADADGPDLHHSLQDGGLQLFSIRGIMAFFTVFGWSGVTMLEMGVPEIAAGVISFLLGSAALVGMAYLIRALMGLQETGNADYRKALGKTARVYIPIPAAGGGQGKINMMLGEKLGEFWAVTDAKERIPTGVSVRIVDLSGGVYTVEREN